MSDDIRPIDQSLGAYDVVQPHINAMQKAVYEHIASKGSYGSTALEGKAELGDKYPGLNTVGPRFTELYYLGAINPVGRRKFGGSSTPATVFVTVPEGQWKPRERRKCLKSCICGGTA